MGSSMISDKVHMLEIRVSNIGESAMRTQDVSDIIDSLKSTNTGLKIKMNINSESSTTVRHIITTIRRSDFNNPVIITLPIFAIDLDLEK